MKQHKKPCKECPFRKEGPHGHVGGATPEHYALGVLGDKDMPCHLTIDYTDPDWRAKWQSQEKGLFCAGALIQASNICKVSSNPKRPVLEADKEAVFDDLPQFINAHRGVPLRLWDELANDTIGTMLVRLHLQMPRIRIDEIGILVGVPDKG